MKDLPPLSSSNSSWKITGTPFLINARDSSAADGMAFRFRVKRQAMSAAKSTITAIKIDGMMYVIKYALKAKTNQISN